MRERKLLKRPNTTFGHFSLTEFPN